MQARAGARHAAAGRGEGRRSRRSTASWAWASTTGTSTTTPNLFVKDIKRNPTNVECFDLVPVQQRALAPLVLQGQADRRRQGGPRQPDEDREGDAGGEPEQQRHRLQRQLERHPRLRHHAPSSPAAHRRAVRRSGRRGANTTSSSPPRRTTSRPGVAPFPGAETGTGGRIRDVQATGTRRPGRGRHRRLLRRQPAHPRLRAALGGPVLCISE